jgi:hypothetical protein
LKTQPRQLLGSLSLAYVLPCLSSCFGKDKTTQLVKLLVCHHSISFISFIMNQKLVLECYHLENSDSVHFCSVTIESKHYRGKCRSFNLKSSWHAWIVGKTLNLKLKTQPRQLLGCLPLIFVLPCLSSCLDKVKTTQLVKLLVCYNSVSFFMYQKLVLECYHLKNSDSVHFCSVTIESKHSKGDSM